MAKAKGGARTATGSFDYDILLSLGGISKSLNMIKTDVGALAKTLAKDQKKNYEESRENLKKSALIKKDKGTKSKKSIIPKMPDFKSLFDKLGERALTFGKIVLAGAFLTGLLQDKITEWVKGLDLDPDSLGGTFIGAFNDLFTENVGEKSMKERFADALGKGAKWAAYGAVIGGVTMGPIGIVVGAIIGGAAGFIKSFIDSDTGDNAKKLQARFEAAAKWGEIGLVAGALLGVFVGPLGLVAGALLGGAAGMLYGLMKEPRGNDETYVKSILDKEMDSIDVSFMDKFVNTMQNVRDSINNFFVRLMNPIRKLLGMKEKAERAKDTAEIDIDELALRQDEKSFDKISGTSLKGIGMAFSRRDMQNNKSITIDKDFAFLPDKTRDAFYTDLGHNQDPNFIKFKGQGTFMPEFGKEYMVNQYLYDQFVVAKEIAKNSKALYLKKLKHFKENNGRNPEEMFNNANIGRTMPSRNARMDQLDFVGPRQDPTTNTEIIRQQDIKKAKDAKVLKELMDVSGYTVEGKFRGNDPGPDVPILSAAELENMTQTQKDIRNNIAEQVAQAARSLQAAMNAPIASPVTINDNSSQNVTAKGYGAEEKVSFNNIAGLSGLSRSNGLNLRSTGN